MSDSPESQPQPQQVPPEHTPTSGLAPPPFFGGNLRVHSEEESDSSATLPRNLSSISFGPEACHIEDINSGCSHEHQKHSILHSATHTPAISRNPSGVDVTHPSVVSAKGVHEDDLTEKDDYEDDGVLEMRVPNINGRSENVQINPPTETSQINSDVVEQGLHSSPSPQLEVSEAEGYHLDEGTQGIPAISETAPVEADTIATSSPTPSEPVHEQQIVEPTLDAAPPVLEHQEDTRNINWQFDDMSELQAHITGPDPFEQLRQQAPARSSTFPPVPPHDEHETTAHYENEKALFNMMASEVATGEGERGMFDSPNTEQGGFFGAPDDSADGDFFNDVSRGETIDDSVDAMMGQVLDAAGIGGLAQEADKSVEDQDARFEEGLPLINHSPEAVTEESDLFGDTDVADDNFFGGLGINGGNEERIPGLERKTTMQVVEGATHPYHVKTDAAASIATADSQASSPDNLADEPISSLFNALPSTVEEGEEDFFSQIGQQPPKEEAEKTPEEEDDLTARWKAALAGDVLEDEDGFLPSDDEGFLPDSDDESAPKPTEPVGGQPQGFSNQSTGSVPFAQIQGSNVPQQPLQQTSSRYTPQQAQPPYRPGQPPYGGAAWQQAPPQQVPLNPYAPSQPSPFSPNATQAYFNQHPAPGPYAAFGAKTPQLPEKKAQSFVDKKEGYQSPYDLPLDVAPPIIRKRPSNLGAQGPTAPGFPPPARSSSMNAVFSPTAPTPGAQKPKPQQENFFEELPLAPPKPRTVSAMGMGGRYSPGPANQLPPRSAGGFAPPPSGPPRPGSTQGFYSQSPQQTFSQPVIGSPQQALPPQQPSAAGSRYSPAPRQASGAYAPPPVPNSAPAMQGYQPPPVSSGPTPTASAPPTAPAKYAPRPAGPPQMARPPTTTGGFVAPPKPVETQLPPGAESPPQKLAQSQGGASPQQVSPTSHFQQPQEDAFNVAQRRFSGDHHAMHSSRPGTARSVSISATMDVPREEEEEALDDSSVSQSNGHPLSAPPPSQNRYAPSRGPGTPTPGQSISRTNTFTPPPGVSQSPRYTSQLPNRTISPEATFQPPPRAQTQSPGMAFGRNNKISRGPRDPYERPSSAFAHTSTYSHSSVDFHQRAQSLQLNFMAPNDETGRDVLKRWQGAPLFTWGFGGNVAVMFPRRAQRYTSDMQQPMIKCSPGEVKIKNIKEILPLEENEGKFPGPAWTGGRNKGKKKDLLAWMGGKIEALEREIEGQGKRAEEKLLLWKVVRVLLENDGVLEGNPEVEKVVRGVLTPEVVSDSDGGVNGGGGSFTMVGDISANMQGPSTDRVDPEAVRNIKTNLLKGDRTAAVWHAADKRLWSHALLIAGTVGKDLWKQVVQEFVKHEVKTLGEGVESLAVLYEIFAGNWAESIDELVSASTRVGVPMLGGAPNGGVNVEEKLDRWRETLGLVLNNRSPGDAEAILALGKLLVAYGRIEAGHICFVFARQGSMGGIGAVLGGHDDPAAHFSLLGGEGGSFTPKDTDAIMLTEIYELALSLAPTPHPAFPHLLSYKLHRALIRAENGHKSEAQKYVDAIIAVIKGWGKPSIYMNPAFMAAVEELNTRLSFAPKDSASGPAPTGAGKWIPKLNSEIVTSSIWETFNTFVSGEKDDAGGAADSKGIDPISGPFARMSSESPNMSRVQSGVDLYSAYNTSSSYGVGMQGGMNPFQPQQQQQFQPPAAAGKYAPQNRNSYDSQQSPYTPAVNHQRNSSADSYRPTYTGGGYEPSGNGNPYEPSGNPYEQKPQQQVDPYEPSGNPYEQKPQQQVNPYDSPHPSSNSTTGFGGNTNTYGSRSSFDEVQSSIPATGPPSFSSAPETPSYGGYEPPSSGGGYEPPSNEFQPYQPEDNNDENDEKAGPKPKKKGFMDDDDDDELLRRAEKARLEEAKKKAEEEKKNIAVDSGAKKGWFGWFGGKKDPNATQGPIKAKLGEESSFVYDPDLKRWVNKKAGETTPIATKPPPPPMKRASTPASASVGMPSRPSSAAPPRSSSSEPPRSPTPAMTPTMPTPSVTPGTPGLSAPPPPLGRSPSPAAMSAQESLSPSTTGPLPGPPSLPSSMTSKPPSSGPPSRPPTAMSSRGGDAMDDLLGPPGASVSRKSTPAGGRKARGKSRYVEVIPGQQ